MNAVSQQHNHNLDTAETREIVFDYQCNRKCRICPFPGAKCDVLKSNKYESMPHYEDM